MNSGEGVTDHVPIVPARTYSDPTVASLRVNSSHNVVAIGMGAKQVQVRAFMWHHTRTSGRIPIEVLVDTGAEDGNSLRHSYIQLSAAEGGLIDGYRGD